MNNSLVVKLATLDASNTNRRDVILTLDLVRIAVMIKRAQASRGNHSEAGPAAVEIATTPHAIERIDLDAANLESARFLATIFNAKAA